ncbi:MULTISPECIES: TniQ family protein [Kitasatospora]|uniref:TniQ domain-containing protein n=1 Tax=Kitasatospora setae (strain ATCC 33774 / DSM 43861 / JCM 3304 / KCC A-0304 / NBRC 14216 / KM-6054) TaxID=452652 RepID=E4NAF2_KITSK|nr:MULTISPECIES: TniQ family protein [Kitasatospora]BAJ28183.1 hypothetical protein KSE_23650 [Kitasatospora setae KM-6054]
MLVGEIGVRRLPTVVAPLPGEALTSWLLAVMELSGIEGSEAARLFGLGGGRFMHATTDVWLRRLTEPQLAGLSQSTGLPAEWISGLTFERLYSNIPLSALQDGSRNAWRYGYVSRDQIRICPSCVGARQGRWSLVWHLPWVLVCPIHSLYLRDACDCGKIFRPPRRTMEVGTCPITGSARARTEKGCGRPLSTLPAVYVENPHLIRAQERLLSVVRSQLDATDMMSMTADDVYAVLLMTLARGSLASVSGVSPAAQKSFEDFTATNEAVGWYDLSTRVPGLPRDALLLEAAVLMSEPVLTADDPLEAASAILPVSMRIDGTHALSDWVHTNWQVQALRQVSNPLRPLAELCLEYAIQGSTYINRQMRRYSGWRSPARTARERRSSASTD